MISYQSMALKQATRIRWYSHPTAITRVTFHFDIWQVFRTCQITKWHGPEPFKGSASSWYGTPKRAKHTHTHKIWGSVRVFVLESTPRRPRLCNWFPLSYYSSMSPWFLARFGSVTCLIRVQAAGITRHMCSTVANQHPVKASHPKQRRFWRHSGGGTMVAVLLLWMQMQHYGSSSYPPPARRLRPTVSLHGTEAALKFHLTESSFPMCALVWSQCPNWRAYIERALRFLRSTLGSKFEICVVTPLR